ncbi:MAG: FtsX-like permease family protein [Cyanothece sp. SIO1E1]|nr:FtsX-like permease family protein [Cyanothece sp. SIO1E1]
MNFIYHLKLSVRNLLKRPLFSGIVIFTIAIAIGANTVVFSFIDALLLSPLPFKESDELVQIYSLKGDQEGLLSYPEFLDMELELQKIEDIAVYRGGGRYNLSGDDQEPEEVTATFASRNLFRVLGVETNIGDYWPETLDRKGSLTVMLTNDFWERRFKADPEVVNRSITLDGVPSYKVYGVLPEGFSFPDRHEAFRAMAYSDRVVTNRRSRNSIGVARLKAGNTIDDLNKELAAFGKVLQERHLDTNEGISFIAKPIKDMYIGGIKNYLLLLGAAAIFLLIIASVNVSNLILSHALRRGKETTLRQVLGASKASIVQQYMIESTLLALLGGALGLSLSFLMSDFSYSLVELYLPHWVNVNISYAVLGFTILISVLVGIATGMLPALSHLSKTDFAESLKDGAKTTGSRSQNKLRRGLVSAEIAISALLLIGGGLLAKSFYNMQEADIGFETENRLTFRIALSWYNYSDDEKIRSFYETSTERIAAIPGVEGVAVNSVLPLTDIVKTSTDAQSVFTIEGQSPIAQAENPYISIQRVTPNYFDVMEIPIKEGEGFDLANPTNDRFKVLIDEQLARQLGDNPVGKQIKLGTVDSEAPYLTVAGVIADVKHQNIVESNIPSVYVSILMDSEIDSYFVVKASVPPLTLAERLRQTIFSIDAHQPTFEYLLMEDHISKQSWQSRISSILFLGIAIIGGLLAAIGLFSVMSFILNQRTKELAVRRVLGAMSGDILRMVILDVLKIAGISLFIAVVLAFIVLQPINKFLYEVSLFYLPVYLLTAIGLIFVSIAATLLPAWRATNVNPTTALKND